MIGFGATAKLLDESFGRDWRSPRTWPWGRMVWAYGFTLVGATSALGVGLLVSAVDLVINICQGTDRSR